MSGGGTWRQHFNSRRCFSSCAQESCALSEYPKSANCFTAIFNRGRFWSGSPRKMTKNAHSPKRGLGGVGGVAWRHRFNSRRFFFHVHKKTVHFLNIEKAPTQMPLKSCTPIPNPTLALKSCTSLKALRTPNLETNIPNSRRVPMRPRYPFGWQTHSPCHPGSSTAAWV